MQSVKESLTSPWRGSEQTAESVREQIRARYGDEIADEYDPSCDAMPFSSWLAQGYAVKKGQKALKSITFVEVKDENDKVIKKIRRTVNLFHRKQVSKMP
jgi:uncharacterized protein YegL